MTPPPALVAAPRLAASPAFALHWKTGPHRPIPGVGIAGVYIVWRADRHGRTCLVVGEARDIAADLGRILPGRHLAGWAATGALAVSWAAVASLHRRGIARWLGTTLAPQIGRTGSADRPIAVNLPA